LSIFVRPSAVWTEGEKIVEKSSQINLKSLLEHRDHEPDQQAGWQALAPNKFSSLPTSRAFSRGGPSTRWIGAGSARDTVATRIA
tara:strand:+ start:159 stop:413 length:255 start_codon:yes stop_codon:yes gene_type:complete